MIRLKHAGLGAALLLACLLGYSFSSSPRVHAASCSGAIAFNRAPGCGWFHNQYAGSGGPMFADGMGTTSTTDELVSYIQGKCDDGGSDETAAAVIVMDSLGYSAPTTGGCSNSSMFNQWAADVKGYGSYGCTSGTCTGPSGRVNFYDSQEYFCGEVDTMLTDINGTYDVAPFNISGSTDPACGTTANDVIIFYNTNNDPIFYIRRDCGNILRAIGHLVAPPPPVIATACTYSVTNYAIPDPDQGYAINAIITYNLSGSASSAAKNGKLSIGVVKVPNGRTDSNVGMNVSGNQVKGSLTEPPPGGQGDDYDNDIQISLNDTKDGPRASINCKGNLEVVNASCGGLSQSPSQIDPAQSFSITTTLTYNPPLGVPPNQANTAYRAFHANVNGGGDDLYNMTVTGPNGVMTPTSRTASYGATGSYSYETVTESFQPTGVPGAINTTYSSSGTMAPTNQSTTIPGGACNAPQVIVASLPYFEVEGGDLEAGAGMYQNGATCSPSADTRAGIASWNQEAPSYDGAGTQYAAMALGVLQDFVTGQGSTASPSGLSFANNTDVAADTFGGAFGALPCMPDYFSPPSDPTQVGGDYTVDINDIAPASSGKKLYIQNGEATINGMSIPNGSHTTVYVSGNVYIDGNISYSGNYSGVSNLPSFMVVVKGDIYIAPGVTNLDGIYVAEPTSATANGVIYTCASAPFTAAALDGNLYNTCKNAALMVNGSFDARQIWLLRTYGTLHANNPAETFNYDPETWLTDPGDYTSQSGGTYDAITSLPPVL